MDKSLEHSETIIRDFMCEALDKGIVTELDVARIVVEALDNDTDAVCRFIRRLKGEQEEHIKDWWEVDDGVGELLEDIEKLNYA